MTTLTQKTTKKLSAPQKRVLALMTEGKGKLASMDPSGSCAVHIDGKRVCNVDTISSLINAGLVEKTARWTYGATAAGRNWKEKI